MPPSTLHEDQRRKGRQRRELAHGPEFRRFSTGLEIRAGAPDGNGMVPAEGQVIVYGVPYHVTDMWGGFTETIHFGAAAPVLARADLDVRFLFNHGDMPYARTGSPTCPLTLSEEQPGLDVRALLDPRMTGAADLIYAMENRLITQMSVGMEVDPDGDIWSGEDDYGMPNVRNIVLLANIFDTSAVTYPASPTTSIELAQRAWARVPAESQERTRRLWQIAKSARAGEVTKADADVLLHALERMHQVDDLRNAPTDEDAKIADAITVAKKAVADAVAAQAADPDNNTDPVDKKVMAALQAAEASLAEAMVSQAKDGTPDKPEVPETKDADGDDDGDTGDDDDYQGDPDGTATTASGDAPVPDGEDGTGSRAAALQEELRLRRAAVEATRRRLAVERARLRAA